LILHLDLDCFYAQVEQRRLNFSPGTPMVVATWVGLVAVNYAARAFGVQRFDSISAATAKCPGLKVVNIEQLEGGHLAASTSSGVALSADARAEQND
jgi:DNA polymerase eta